MEPAEIIICIIFLALSAGSFFISYFQFREKGFLFNNAYLWATRDERRRMDENRESKRPHYRQSGFAFMFIGILCLIFAAYIAADRIWLLFAFGLVLIITIVYAVVSSVKIERQK